MNGEIIQVLNNKAYTTSLIVAEKFNKRHDNVLRDISNILETLSGALNFEVSSKLDYPLLFKKSNYVSSQNKILPMYLINRDGFTLLAMGFTGEEALEWKLKYIKAFNDMEERLKAPLEDNRLEIAKLLAKSPKYRIEAIKLLYPEYFSNTLDPNSLEYTSEINSSYRAWIETLEIGTDFIFSFPTTEIYNNYLRFCHNSNILAMGKKTFYRTIELDFNSTKKQKSNGRRYFISL